MLGTGSENGMHYPDPAGSTSLTLTNARVILPNHVLERGTVRIDHGVITVVAEGGLTSETDQPTVLDLRGAWLMPGVVDVHNDNLEHEIHPRASANLPLPFALSNMERRLASSGITTEFHAVSFQDNLAKQRSIHDARGKAAFLMQFEDDPRHGVRHHILHRLDVRTPHSIDHAMPTLLASRTPYASLNDHTPGQGQYRDVERLIARNKEQAALRNSQPRDAEWYRERMRTAMADTETVPAFYQRVGELMATTSLVLASHDDDSVEKVDEQLRLGARVAEFPITYEAAAYAKAHEMAIVVGAPNIVRGGSQSGNLSAMELIRHGYGDIICADYHAPSLLAAAWIVAREGARRLPEAVSMITRNPARALGLTDRGEIAVGQLGDLTIVREDGDGWPHAEATVVGGRAAFTFIRNPEVAMPIPSIPPVPSTATGA